MIRGIGDNTQFGVAQDGINYKVSLRVCVCLLSSRNDDDMYVREGKSVSALSDYKMEGWWVFFVRFINY